MAAFWLVFVGLKACDIKGYAWPIART